MSGLPDGWRQATLGELGRYLNGRGFKKSEWRESGRPIIRIQNLTGSSVSHNYFDGEADERHVARPGDLLVSWAATLGAYIWRGPDAVVNQHIFKVESNIDTVFHKYLLDYHLDSLKRQTHGSGIVHITRGKFDSTPVRIPVDIAEQRRIVDLLEDHLSRVDAAMSSLSSNRRRIERLRLSSVSQALFNKDLWPQSALSELLEATIGGVWGSAPGEDEVDVKVLRVTEMQRDGALDSSTAVTRSLSEKQLASRRLRAGDLLLEKSGGGPTTPVGRVGLVPEIEQASTCSNFMQLLRPRRDLVSSEYLHLYLQAFYLRGGTETMQKASTNIRNLKASEYVRIPVPVPDLETQRHLVNENESLTSAARRLDSALVGAARRGAALRRALLEAAFSGRLTGRSSDSKLVEKLAEAAS